MGVSNTHRIAYWDNLKAILIFLVVLGHFLLPVHDKRGTAVNAVYTWIYLFHMPAFVFVSGFFSKRYVKDGAKDARKILGFFMLYIIYSIPNWASTALIARDTIHYFSPRSAQWYLLCMSLWYIIVPFCAKIRPLPMIVFSIILGLLVGMENMGNFLSLSRCLVFFPFFLAGYYFEYARIADLKKQSKIIACIVLLAAFISVFMFPVFYSKHISVLYADSAYTSFLYGSVERLIWYILSSVLVFSLLSIIPQQPLPFTYIGRRTLAIYIFHRPIRGVIRHIGLYDHFVSDIHILSFCLIASLVFTFLLSERHITDLLNKAFTSDYKIFLSESSR